MNNDNLQSTINHAMKNGGVLLVYYRTKNGDESERLLKPLKWEIANRTFKAYCHRKQMELTFTVDNIQEWKFFNSEKEALLYLQNPPESTPVRPTLARNISPSTSNINNVTHPKIPIFAKVTKAEEWSALIQYYADCLSLENRQQLILDTENICNIDIDKATLYSFLEKGSKLIVPKGERFHRGRVSKFIQEVVNDRNHQLCLGYPFFVPEPKKAIPLTYITVTIEQDQENFILVPDNLEISYALLTELKMSEEEIADFLQKCEQINPAPGEARLQALENFVQNKINEIYKVTIPIETDWFKADTIYDRPALFKVKDNIATANLIRELYELAGLEKWEKAPITLRQLLNIIPDHNYPEGQPWENDNSIHVTPINQNQFRVIQAIRTEPLVIVTGPPGTGKSQVVLNLIAEAFLKGEKVLFASRNNQAVDVVMRRLIEDIKFLGAVRTGNKNKRAEAAAQMRRAMNQVMISEQQDLEGIKKNYFSIRQQMLQDQTQLDAIRNLKGLLESYKDEREYFLKLLPQPICQVINDFMVPYSAAEFETLVNLLSSYLDSVLTIKEEKEKIENHLTEIEERERLDDSLIAEFHRIKDQWGSFCGKLLEKQSYPSIDALLTHLYDWINIIEILKMKYKNQMISDEIKRLENELVDTQTAISEDLLGFDKSLAEQLNQEQLEGYAFRANAMIQYLVRYLQGDLSFGERFFELITFKRQLRKRKQEIIEILLDLNLPQKDWIKVKVTANKLIQIAGQLKLIMNSAILDQKLQNLRDTKQGIQKDLEDRIELMAAPILNDLDKLNRLDFDYDVLLNTLLKIVEKTRELQDDLDNVVHVMHSQLVENQEQFKLLEKLRATPLGEIKLLTMIEPSSPIEEILNYIRDWQNLLGFWKADAGYQHTTRKLAVLPSEEQAIEMLNSHREQMFDLGGLIMRLTWQHRVRQAPNEIVQKVNDYIAAVEALSPEDLSPADKNKYKDIEKANLSPTIQLFPIWATTNLSARTNFPLESQYFDLIIIDEASQCDVPSALPLLFRGKKAVIIGDPNQLRHVATIRKEDDQSLAYKHGVDIGAFSYNSHSLFDLAERSSGNHPGSLLLNEHYRSDARIINFSNQLYYENRLTIKTDLTQRRIPRTFLNQFGGIYWIDVKGYAEYPRGGSIYNLAEVKHIQTFLPQLSQWLKKNGLDQLTIGIVTPYRAQNDYIKQQLSDTDWENRITIGTAHQFQGDERDVMIFSPVISQGIKKESLRWLQQTRNLLNVAVSRARVILFVLGDFEYCKSLENGHCFKELAEYVERSSDRIISNEQISSWLEDSRVDIIGIVTTPHNPEYNRTTLRRFISSCSDFVWWVDRYFNDHVMDLFRDVFKNPNVYIQDIRLLTAKELTQASENNKPELKLTKYHLLRKELASRGINFEIRLLNRRDLPHDRFLYTADKAINMPPFASAYGDHRNVSEYTFSKTDKRAFFEEYWNKGEVIPEQPTS